MKRTYERMSEKTLAVVARTQKRPVEEEEAAETEMKISGGRERTAQNGRPTEGLGRERRKICRSGDHLY